jgi:hypothetical protein
MLKCAMVADFKLSAENQCHSGFHGLLLPRRKNQYSL